MRQAVILAGGAGTRLRERLGELPKPLVDVAGTPLLGRQLSLLRRHAFTHALVLVHHGARHVGDFLSRGDWDMEVRCLDDGRPLGTAGATLAAFECLAEEFLVVYGDVMLEVDLSRFHAFHSARPAAATLLLHPNDHPQDSDLVELDEDERVTAFHAYPHDAGRDYSNLVNAALYWVRKDGLLAWRDMPPPVDFGRHLFPAMLERGALLRGYRSPEYVKDIGTPARLDRVCADLRSGKIERSSLERPQPMVLLDRDGTINREVDGVRRPEELELLPGAAEAIRRLNASDYRCCVVTNQPVVARGECSPETLRRVHDRLETLLGRQGAYLDRIYHCPHHPDRGFPGERAELKIVCDCRKPRTGLVERAMREFNVVRERSWLVGDSSVDIESARRAGLRSILVETGHAGLDYRAWATPDFTVPDLAGAVAFILDRYPRLLKECSHLAEAIAPGAVVLVGGQSRSGKSTFASVLRDALAARGVTARVLCVDRWLKAEPERGPGVLGRFDMGALQTLLESVADPRARPVQLTLPGYHKLKRERREAVETLALAPADVVVLEGVVALALAVPPAIESHRFHVEIDEEERKRRVLGEYRLRGYAPERSLEVYGARRDDEVPVIAGLARTARTVRLPA